MKKQDDMLKQLFDDYASELAPREHLSSAAREEMTALNVQQKPSVSARKNKGFVRQLGWIIPVSLVFVMLVVLVAFGPALGLFDPNQGNHNAQNPPVTSNETIYTFADVKGKSVTLSDCNEELQISRLTDAGYVVLNARYYAFYTEDGELRYIKSLLGVRNAEGVFTEIELIAEVDGYVRADLKFHYDSFSDTVELVYQSDYADNGEYVTQAYFTARDMHFYVVARNGQATLVAKEIILLLSY